MPPPNNSPREATLAEALFRPRAVALIGVSDDPGKTAGRPLPFLRKHGFPGRIFPVNPHRPTVQGENALKRLEDAPEAIDHAYILVNTPAVEDAVRGLCEAFRQGKLPDSFGNDRYFNVRTMKAAGAK